MKEDRMLFLSGPISNETTAPLLQRIIEINNRDTFENNECEPIHLFIDSPGGFVYDALSLVSAIEASKTPVYTYCYGYAMSAALTIFVCGHRRYAGKYARFMLHQVYLDNDLNGKLSEVAGMVNEFKRLDEINKKIIISKTKLTSDIFMSHDYFAKDLFIDVQEAIKYGIVDELIT